MNVRNVRGAVLGVIATLGIVMAGESGARAQEPPVPIFFPVPPGGAGTCSCPPATSVPGRHESITGRVESSSTFYLSPYDPAAALDGNDFDDYAAHFTYDDYPNWFVVGLSAMTDLSDITIVWGNTALYGEEFEVLAYLDVGTGFEWQRVASEVGWRPNGTAAYVKQFPTPYQRVCKLALVVRDAAGQERTILRRFAWNQLAQFGATVTASSRFFSPPWDVLAALDGNNDNSDYAAYWEADRFPNWFQLKLRRSTDIHSVQVHWYSTVNYATDFQVLALRRGQWLTVANESSWAPSGGSALYNRVLPSALTEVEALALVVRRTAGQSRMLLRQLSWNRPLLTTVRYTSVSDHQHAEYPVVLKDGSVYKMWYSGLNLRDGHWRIHYAVSTDGLSWQKYGMVLDVGQGDAWDAANVAFPFVVKDATARYHMWYAGNKSSNSYEIGYASSGDGIHWVRSAVNPVIPRSRLGARLIMDPSVIYDPSAGPNKFEMWLNVFGAGSAVYVYRTFSADGVNWSTLTQVPFLSSVRPYTVEARWENGAWSVYYAALAIGQVGLDVYRTTSLDAVNWSAPVRILDGGFGSASPWDSYANYGMSAIVDDNGQRRMWYNGVPVANRCDGTPFGTGHIGTALEVGGTWVKDADNPVLRAGAVVGY